MKNAEDVASTLPGGSFVKLREGFPRLAALAWLRGLPLLREKLPGAMALPARSGS
ncbi:MAG TPA: hypothetical protein VFE77_07225 [Rhodanobacter sp.]|nr:hypothetical protein [Rhodanobacter sp.]